MLGATAFNFVCSEGETNMSRQARIKIAALATAVLATLGTVGATASIATPDAKPMYKNGSWCC